MLVKQLRPMAQREVPALAAGINDLIWGEIRKGSFSDNMTIPLAYPIQQDALIRLNAYMKDKYMLSARKNGSNSTLVITPHGYVQHC